MKRHYFVLALFLSYSVFLNSTLAEEKLRINLRAKNYSTIDGFTLSIENTSKIKHSFSNIKIEALLNEEWKSVRTDITCRCLAKCRKSPILLVPGGLKERKWDFKDDSCKIVSPGTYRAIVHSGWNAKLEGQEILGISEPFVIHEKTTSQLSTG